MPRRCRGTRGDVGIAPYETTAEKTIPPSRLRRDTSLAQGRQGVFRACGRGERIPTPVTSVTGSE